MVSTNKSAAIVTGRNRHRSADRTDGALGAKLQAAALWVHRLQVIRTEPPLASLAPMEFVRIQNAFAAFRYRAFGVLGLDGVFVPGLIWVIVLGLSHRMPFAIRTASPTLNALAATHSR